MFLQRYPSRLKQLLPQLRIPVVQGPFGGGASSVELVAACSNNGALGSFGAHYVAPGDIAPLVAQLRAAVDPDAPFAVNLWCHIAHDDRANLAALNSGGPEYLEKHAARVTEHYKKYGAVPPGFPDGGIVGHRFDEQVKALLDANPPVISFVMGVPPPAVIEEARRRGIVTFGCATTVAEALALEHAGIDAIVASGVEAGGHRGTFLKTDPNTPVPDETTFTLVPRVRAAVSKKIPVIAAGGVSTPEAALAALTLGADAVQIGTAFVVSDESGAAPVHKAVILDKSDPARRACLTRAFTGRSARGIPNQLAKDLYQAEVNGEIPGYPVQNYITVPLRKKAGRAGDKDGLLLWSGQAGTLVQPGKAAEILKRFEDGVDDAAKEIAKFAN
ncbi:hypothetical protein HDU81_006204 [Chytriomyces hyalinus]|nr:hypothetical protein HDU81_006204 [Chytriomyces hyalinus]